MKRIFTVFVLTGFLFISLSTRAQYYFDITYDFGAIDHPLAIVTDSLENIYVCGWFEDINQQNQRAFVIKTDADGQELWRETLNDSSKFNALCLTHTGNLALAGSRNNRCFITLLNSQNGNEIWANEQAGTDNYWLATVDEIIDSNKYKLYSQKAINSPDQIRYELFDSSNGDFLFEGSNINTLYGVAYTSLLVDSSRVWTAGDVGNYGDGFVFEHNFVTGGGFYWTFSTEHIAGLHHYSPDYACETDYFKWPDGEYYMGVLTMYLPDIDVWGNAFHIEQDTFNVTGSGKFYLGNFVITGTIDNELSLWFIDHDLTYMTDKIINTDKPRAGVDVVCLPSLDMIVMGTEQPDNSDNTNVFIMKLDSSGVVSTPEHQVDKKFVVYPNPVGDVLYVKSRDNTLNQAKVRIVNSFGQTVKKSPNLNQFINLSGLPEGLYVVVVYDGNDVLYRQKIVKQ